MCRKAGLRVRVCERLSSGMLIDVPDQVHFPRCGALIVPHHRAREGMSLSPTFRQVHEMQSGLARLAFAIVRPAGYQQDAFQASSPTTSRVAFRGPFFCLNTFGTAYLARSATRRSRLVTVETRGFCGEPLAILLSISIRVDSAIQPWGAHAEADHACCAPTA